MKKKIKLRDITVEQWYNNKALLCKLFGNRYCDNFIFQGLESYTASYDKNSGFNNNDFYNNRFLDLEIEIDIPNILNKEEKKYLSTFIKSFRDKVISISRKIYTITRSGLIYQTTYFIDIQVDKEFVICGFQIQNNMYENMELDKQYTLAELGL